MKLTILFVSAASAAAFAPVAQKSTTTSLSAGKAKVTSPFAEELGAQPPLGFFDPAGMLNDVTPEGFNNIREIEIKHGRVAMLAVTGYLTTAAGIRFPGAEDIPAGFGAWKALSATADGSNVLLQMAATILVMEICNRDVTGDSAFPGDYRNGALDFGWDKLDDKTKLKKRAVELNNGRAAQMGILGLMVHEALGNSILPGGYLP